MHCGIVCGKHWAWRLSFSHGRDNPRRHMQKTIRACLYVSFYRNSSIEDDVRKEHLWPAPTKTQLAHAHAHWAYSFVKTIRQWSNVMFLPSTHEVHSWFAGASTPHNCPCAERRAAGNFTGLRVPFFQSSSVRSGCKSRNLLSSEVRKLRISGNPLMSRPRKEALYQSY